MRVISNRPLRSFWRQHAKAAKPLDEWFKKAQSVEWENFHQTRLTFPHTDRVGVASGRIATVFNAGGNDYRIITAIHYNTQKVFVLRVLTHREYNKGTWKKQL